MLLINPPMTSRKQYIGMAFHGVSICTGDSINFSGVSQFSSVTVYRQVRDMILLILL